MKRFASILLPIAVISAIAATPAAANWFSSDPSTGVRRHIGSAPNPKPSELRAMRAAEAAKQTAENVDLNKPATSAGS